MHAECSIVPQADGTLSATVTASGFRKPQSLILAMLGVIFTSAAEASELDQGNQSGEGGSGGPGLSNDPGQPTQGQYDGQGNYITAQLWFLDRGFPLPAGPDGVSDGVGDVGPDFIWAPNVPSQDDPAFDTAPWVWRPPFATI